MSTLNLLFIFIVAAVLLALNPFNISLFLMLLAGSFGKNHHKTTTHVIAVSFLLAYLACIALLGMLLTELFSDLSKIDSTQLGLAVASLAIIWGLITLKSFFWYGQKSHLPNNLAGLLHTYTTKDNRPTRAVLLGFITALISLIYIGVAIMSLAVIIALLKPHSLVWLLLLAVILLIPLVLIFIYSLLGIKISAILKWKEDNKSVMQLSVGLVHIILGWTILLILNGSLGLK